MKKAITFISLIIKLIQRKIKGQTKVEQEVERIMKTKEYAELVEQRRRLVSRKQRREFDRKNKMYIPKSKRY